MRRRGIIIIVLFFIVVVGAGFAVLQNYQSQGSHKNSESPEENKKEFTPYPNFQGIPINDQTISFVKADGKFCLRYNGKVYLPQDTGSLETRSMSDAGTEAYPWIGLVNPPDGILTDKAYANEIFSFKASPRNESFIFITRWTRQGGEEYIVYRFNSSEFSELVRFTPSFGLFYVPKVSSFSPGGNFVDFKMFQNPYLRDEYPETQLMYIPTKELKFIGVVTEFRWKEDGIYEYQTYNQENPSSETGLRRNEFFEDSVNILPTPAPLSL